MAIFYPFADQLPFRQVLGSTLLIIFISIAIIIVWKRLPYLFVGWLWYAVTLLPVIGIIRTSAHSMHDKYTYLPSIGLAIMLAWGIPSLIKNEVLRKRILFLTAITLFAVMSALTWKQCGYWKNSAVLWSRALRVTEDNYLAYNGQGMAYGELHQYERAFEDFNQSIRLKPDYAYPYYNRGNIYSMRGQYQQAIDDYNRAIRLRLDYAYVYNNRGIAYLKQGNKELGCRDVQKACELGDCGLLKLLKDRDCH
jgi:tetratricopeptide (TPR) repeat protein